MMPIITPALVPAGEAERLLTLRHYDILHSLQEAVFNEFVKLAARIFRVPLSLLALVDADEVEYKANHGLADLRHQPRPEAICAQVVARGQPLLFADLTRVPVAQLPTRARLAALARGLRFYAGVPLRLRGQCSIGTLCVLGRQPRPFSQSERQVLEQLAQLIERVIVVRHACLASSWLGREYWQSTQEYITETLCRLGALLGPPPPAAPGPVPDSALRPIIGQLNELGWVLAEPLPGFA